MRIEESTRLDFCDVLIRPKRSNISSRKQVSLSRRFKFKNGKTWEGVPIVASNMDTIGTIEMSKSLTKHNMITCLSKHIDFDDVDKLTDCCTKSKVCFSFGMDEKGRSTLLSKNRSSLPVVLTSNSVKFLCLDVANGYSEDFIDFVKDVRARWPQKIIIAGNVVTGEMVEALLLAGADIIKLGIGPGSVCTTRLVAGVGYPQLSAISECADFAHGMGGYVMADGGCINPGDISKAFGAGADFVMLGGMLSGHDECLGEDVSDFDGNITHKVFYGMSSETAMNKHNGGVACYRAAEGKTVKVPYKGSVDSTVQSILGGIRSTCAYVGAKRIKDLPKCTTFIRSNRQENRVYS
jgi:GMP reductase